MRYVGNILRVFWMKKWGVFYLCKGKICERELCKNCMGNLSIIIIRD